MTKHTPEPWMVASETLLRGPHGEPIASTKGHAWPEDPNYAANTQRIVACVNACEGINPEAVPDLLAACEALVSRVTLAVGAGEDRITIRAVSAIFRDAHAAIRRARGES